MQDPSDFNTFNRAVPSDLRTFERSDDIYRRSCEHHVKLVACLGPMTVVTGPGYLKAGVRVTELHGLPFAAPRAGARVQNLKGAARRTLRGPLYGAFH